MIGEGHGPVAHPLDPPLVTHEWTFYQQPLHGRRTARSQGLLTWIGRLNGTTECL